MEADAHALAHHYHQADLGHHCVPEVILAGVEEFSVNASLFGLHCQDLVVLDPEWDDQGVHGGRLRRHGVHIVADNGVL